MSPLDKHLPITVLILSRDAEVYQRMLGEGDIANVRWLTATGPDSLPEGAAQATIALGEPDLLTAAIERLPDLKWAQSTWAGLTPLVPAASNGLTVTGIKEVFGQQMAEYVLAYTLSHLLQLPERARAQDQGLWMEQPTGTLATKTIGIMGTGSIGAAIARQVGAFETRVLGYSLSGAAHKDFESVFGADQLGEFLTSLDVLVAVLPDTPKTSGLLDAPMLRRLRHDALLINVGRGSLIVESDLVETLNTGHLAGAVLDVFQTEPLPAGHPFWHTPRLTLTAHVAARSWPRDIAAIFSENFERYCAGRALRYRLNPSRGY